MSLFRLRRAFWENENCAHVQLALVATLHESARIAANLISRCYDVEFVSRNPQV